MQTFYHLNRRKKTYVRGTTPPYTPGLLVWGLLIVFKTMRLQPLYLNIYSRSWSPIIRCFDFSKVETMSRIIRVSIQNYLHHNKNRDEVKNREIRYLLDLSIVNLLSVYALVGRILNYYPNYPTDRLYFKEVEALINHNSAFQA